MCHLRDGAPASNTMNYPTKPKPVGFNFDTVFPIFALVLVDVLGLTVILPLLHLYAAVYGATPLEIGLVAAAFPAAQLIGVPLMGALSDRYGRKPLLLISQMTTCIGFLMLALANSLAWIVLSRVIDGLFGANLSTAQAALSDVTDNSNRTQALGITGAAFGIGFILGPAIAVGTFEVTNSLAIPALTAAVYSFISILLTLFMFRETLPPDKRGKASSRRVGSFLIWRYLRNAHVNVLLMLMFAQQVIFFAFESLLGLFTLSRLGMLGQGNAFLLVIVGIILVTIQVGFIGRWSRKYGERRLIFAALFLLAIGLLLIANTPLQPHPNYVRRIAEQTLFEQRPSGTQAIIGPLNVTLPSEVNRGFGGLLYIIGALIPLSIGAALIRPALNGLITKRVPREEFGAVLGVSASLVSAADAIAPIIGGLIFQAYGVAAPYTLAGLVMSGLFILSLIFLRGGEKSRYTSG